MRGADAREGTSQGTVSALPGALPKANPALSLSWEAGPAVNRTSQAHCLYAGGESSRGVHRIAAKMASHGSLLRPAANAPLGMSPWTQRPTDSLPVGPPQD